MLLQLTLAQVLYRTFGPFHISDDGHERQAAVFRDGLYQVAYCTPEHFGGGSDLFLASVRGGRILGSDRHGGIYLSHDEGLPGDGAGLVHLSFQIPPDGELVTGFAAGPEGATITVSGWLDHESDRQKAVVDVAGGPVEIEISYLGPLPDDA